MSTNEGDMHYKLLGFTQDGSVRRFTFHRIRIGIPPVVFVVLADTALARRYKVGLQELPSLCTSVLEAAGADAVAGTMSLSEDIFTDRAASNNAAAAQIAAARALRSRRASLAIPAKATPDALPTVNTP
jgi:hypothetical protein